jgi:hypothetical protein
MGTFFIAFISHKRGHLRAATAIAPTDLEIAAKAQPKK